MKNTTTTDYKPNKEVLAQEYTKVWGKDHKMVDYCVNKAAAIAILPAGEIIEVEKETIKTSFCFDDSYDYEGAQDMAAHARRSEAYLKAQNMKDLDSWVNDLEEVYNGDMTTSSYQHYVLTISNRYDRAQDCNIKSINWTRLVDILDDCGGSAFINELPGKTLNHYGREYRVATKEEIAIILDLYKYAREKHEKKVDSYIKRYGTTKVNSWTYWGMA